jgi:serine/threonine protein kinase
MISNTNSNSNSNNQNIKLNKSKSFENYQIKKNEKKMDENDKNKISNEQKQINNLKNDEKYKDIIKNDDTFKLTEYIAEKYGFEISNIIGKGGYSYVFEIKTIKASNIYACKIEIVKNQNSTSQEIKKTEEKNLLKEIEKSLSKTLKNVNIIKTLATFKDEFKIDNVTYTIHSIFMEKSKIGNLNKFIQIFNKGYICRNTINPNNYKIKWLFNLSEFTIKKFVNDIVNGLQYIKLAKLVHLDLKPENILLCREYILKICDFSLLKIIDPESKKTNINFSTFVYQDPNVYNDEKSIDTKNIYKVDLFSLGCIIYFMIFKKLLIDKNLKNYNYIKNTKINVMKCVENGIKEIDRNEEISTTLKKMLLDLLNPDLEKRISLDELSQNKFLNEGLENIKKCVYSNYNEHYKTFIELQKMETLGKEKKFLNKKRIFKIF